MSKLRIRYVDIAYFIVLVAADIFVYIILGLSLMHYDDNYNSSKIMDTFDNTAFILMDIWNVLNITALIYIGYKIYMHIKYSTRQSGNGEK